MTREIVLDTETTGLNDNGAIFVGHRVIEIGCVEVMNGKITGREFQTYLNPGRDVDPRAVDIHGITTKFLKDKPSFKKIAKKFLDFVTESVLVIHNAPFDMSFLNQELSLSGFPPLQEKIRGVVDTLALSRKNLPGRKHNLDTVAAFFNVETRGDKAHSALLDARILAKVYLKLKARCHLESNFSREHILTTYIRTKTVFKNRLKDLKDYETVKVYLYELDKLGANNGFLLNSLRSRGEIWYDNNGNFKALRDGPIKTELLERTRKREKIKVPLTALHRYMRDQLFHIDITLPEKEIPVYFQAFLKHREEDINPFFTVDGFSGRIHTPVVNLKHDLRKHLLFFGEPLVSLDVKQMQPTILAKVLNENIGDNPFSNAIFSGEDVYDLLEKRNRMIKNRAEAKKFLFHLIFGKPVDMGHVMDGDNKWVDWVNFYKSSREPRNPHSSDMHTNLAWLLQYKEVFIMSFIWERLWKNKIPFVTIHDDVLCREEDKDTVLGIMNEELRRHFKKCSVRVG